MPGVNRKEDWVGGSIVDGNESRRGDDGVLDILHRLLVLFLPGKVGILACEVDERSGQRGVVVDPNTHCSCHAKECADVRDGFARWPGADFCYFQVVWDMALVCALVAKDKDFWGSEE